MAPRARVADPRSFPAGYLGVPLVRWGASGSDSLSPNGFIGGWLGWFAGRWVGRARRWPHGGERLHAGGTDKSGPQRPEAVGGWVCGEEPWDASWVGLGADTRSSNGYGCPLCPPFLCPRGAGMGGGRCGGFRLRDFGGLAAPANARLGAVAVDWRCGLAELVSGPVEPCNALRVGPSLWQGGSAEPALRCLWVYCGSAEPANTCRGAVAAGWCSGPAELVGLDGLLRRGRVGGPLMACRRAERAGDDEGQTYGGQSRVGCFSGRGSSFWKEVCSYEGRSCEGQRRLRARGRRWVGGWRHGQRHAVVSTVTVLPQRRRSPPQV